MSFLSSPSRTRGPLLQPLHREVLFLWRSPTWLLRSRLSSPGGTGQGELGDVARDDLLWRASGGVGLPSCPAMKSSTSPGTSSGSPGNVPSHRTVVSCSAKPAASSSVRNSTGIDRTVRRRTPLTHPQRSTVTRAGRSRRSCTPTPRYWRPPSSASRTSASARRSWPWHGGSLGFLGPLATFYQRRY